jgi:LPS-assembly lipoprotein
MIKKITSLISLSFLCLLLSACGFHLRSQRSLPAQLHNVYFSSKNSSIALNSDITSLLKSLNVTLAPNASKAPITLLVSNYRYAHRQPSITTSNQAITFTYSLSINYQLLKSDQTPITASRTLSVSYDQMMNANQIYLNNNAPTVERRLQKEIVNILYDQLISQRLKDTLSMKKS